MIDYHIHAFVSWWGRGDLRWVLCIYWRSIFVVFIKFISKAALGVIISLTGITLCFISHVWDLHGCRKEQPTFAFESPSNTVYNQKYFLFLCLPVLKKKEKKNKTKRFLNSLYFWEKKNEKRWNETWRYMRSHFIHSFASFRHSDNNHCFKRGITELAWTLTKALQSVGFWRLQYLWGKKTYRKNIIIWIWLFLSLCIDTMYLLGYIGLATGH